MPRGSRALLPARIRTHSRPKPAGADALMGFSASPEHSPNAGGPASRSLPSCTSADRDRRANSTRSEGRYSRASTNARVGCPSRGGQLS
jgi:hypothetical protein